MKPQTFWIGLAVAGWVVALGLAVHHHQNSPQIPGSGGRFEAHEIYTNGANYTAICRAKDGETVWAEYTRNQKNPRATVFSYGGKNILIAFTLEGESPAFEFTFSRADGTPTERWMAAPGSGTWDERINFGTNHSVLERLVLMNNKWEPVVMRDDKRGVLAKDNWVQLVFTNGSWRPLDRAIERE